MRVYARWDWRPLCNPDIEASRFLDASPYTPGIASTGTTVPPAPRTPSLLVRTLGPGLQGQSLISFGMG